ncbi:Hypp8621 [Branchiostoma lanceolatum]|uniref:Hypp8621 protein n=1 Tax=Branchiostoma lanceolatum TaxID=7740 RepID=A0A8J9Z9A6_BRALA|nr:Hypp8621 [Branchiostoma lanceolatum]
MGVDRSCNPQIVAIVLSDVISNENRTRSYADRHSNNVSTFGHEEMTNVTCLVNTWEETYRHVFTTPLSSTPDGTVCAGKTQSTRAVSSTPDGTVCTREGMTLTTGEPNIKTTKLIMNQTNPSTNGTVKEKSPLVAIIILMVVVVGVVLVALFVGYVIRRQRCCSKGDQATQADSGAQGPSSSGDELQYCEIPDEYYNQQNTAASTASQTDNDYSQIPDEYFNYYNTRPGAQHPYWQIPDEYYNYYNTRPEAQHPYWEIPDEYYNRRRLSCPLTHQDDMNYSVRLNATPAELALPSSTRLGGKHPSYDTALQVWRDPQNYQIPALGRQTNIRAGNSGHQYMGLIGNYKYNRRRLSYPPDDMNYMYSVISNAATAKVALHSSTRLGGKHPSYDTAPQVWRDPQNYQIPARGRQTNIRAGNSGHQYMGLISSYKHNRRRLSYPQDYSVISNAATAKVALPSSTRLGGKHPSYDTTPQVWRDPQNYQIPARGRQTNIRAGNSGHQYMSLIGNYKHNRRRLSYPLTLRVPQDDTDYSVRFMAATAELALPSSTRLGGKHPSYDTAPQVWRDPQNYQIPAHGRQTNIRAHGMPVSGNSSGPRYQGLIGTYSRTMRAAKFGMQTMPLYNKPPTQPSRHQRSAKHQAALKAKPSENKNHTSTSCQQASKGAITTSQGHKSDNKGQVHRSKSLGMKDESTNKASHHRQSI